MYLLYVDESGRPSGTSNRYFVLGGIAAHEQDAYPLARSLDRLVARAVPEEPSLELHASRMWSGRHEWARIPPSVRRRLVRDVVRQLRDWRSTDGRRTRLFAVALHKPSFEGRDLVTLAHEQLFSRFDEYISRLFRAGEAHRSLVVADDSSYASLIQRLVPRWKAAGTRMGRLHSFAEVPLYVDSAASRVVQAADFVAWSTWHYYEHGHVEHLQRLNRRFDADTGVQHGLTHMVRGYGTCPCGACQSRSEHKIPARLRALE